MQIGSPVKLKTLLVLGRHPLRTSVQNEKLEKFLHIEFNNYRIHGEWFDFNMSTEQALNLILKTVEGQEGPDVTQQ